jgi:ABC-type transporter MlaC component
MDRSVPGRQVVLVVACLWAGAAADAPQTAVDVAKQYTQKMKSAEPATAVRDHWDMDAMLAGIFGDHLRRHSDPERAEMKRLLLEFVEKVYANPKIADAMKQASFEDFTSMDEKPGSTVTVNFKLRFEDKVIPNSLRMKQVDGKWRITDAGANGRMMVPSLRAQYEPDAQKVTPLQFVRAMVTPDKKE